MRILLITQWYKPINAPIKRMVRIAEYFANKKDCQVTILTGMPSYPTGILPAKYRKKLWVREKDAKVDIVRTYEYPAPNKGIVKRLINNISFTVSASIATLILPSYDIVIVSSPSFLSGIAALAATLWRKNILIFDIRDLWPDSAIDLHFITKKWLIYILRKLESLYYKKAKFIFGATPDIINHLKSEKIPSNKLILLLNSVDTKIYKPIRVNRDIYGFSKNDFLVSYTGNHSSVQNLEIIIKTAKILKNKPRIKFLFVGEGEEKVKLIELSKKLKLKNTFFWPLQTLDEIIRIINISDICDISLAPMKIFQNAIPTKTSEYLACGKPIIASVGGDLKKYINEYQAGLIYKSNDSSKCARVILKLYKNPRLKQKMGQNARQLAIEVFSNEKFYHTLDNIFSNFQA